MRNVEIAYEHEHRWVVARVSPTTTYEMLPDGTQTVRQEDTLDVVVVCPVCEQFKGFTASPIPKGKQ